MVRVVTTNIGRGPCPIIYPRICTLYAQSRGSGSDKYVRVVQKIGVIEILPRALICPLVNGECVLSMKHDSNSLLVLESSEMSVHCVMPRCLLADMLIRAFGMGSYD
jgi:hypothetical protein